MDSPLESTSPSAEPPKEVRPVEWDPSEIIGVAWERFKESPGTFIAVFLLAGIGPAIAQNALSLVVTGEFTFYPIPSKVGWGPNLTVSLAGMLISFVLEAWQISFLIAAARGKSVRLADLFGGMESVLPCLASTLAVVLATVIGTLFCIVPGVIAALALSPAVYVAVDRNLYPLAALKLSWEMTNGHRVNIFVLGLLGLLVNFGGFLACGLGLFISIPVVTLTHAYLYLKLARDPKPAEPEPISPPRLHSPDGARRRSSPLPLVPPRDLAKGFDFFAHPAQVSAARSDGIS